jgi:hypothetical protein
MEYNKKTIGEKLIGISYVDGTVERKEKIKELFADIINLLDEEQRSQNLHGHPLASSLYNSSISSTLEAQALTEKALTVKEKLNLNF